MEEMCSVIKGCGVAHHTLSDKFCAWCLDDGTFSQKGGYKIWHYDLEGRRICRRCYLYQLQREKAIGISRPKIYQKFRDETRTIFKWLNMKATP